MSTTTPPEVMEFTEREADTIALLLNPSAKLEDLAAFTQAKGLPVAGNEKADHVDAIRAHLFTVALDGLEGEYAKVTIPVTGRVQRAAPGPAGQPRFRVGRLTVTAQDILDAAEAPAPPARERAERPGTRSAEETDRLLKDGIENLPAAIVEYVTSSSSTDILAPMHGAPFMQRGRVYVPVDTRHGAAANERVEATGGLFGYIQDRGNGLTGLTKRDVITVLTRLGFTRVPFVYEHPTRGATNAAYFWLPATGAFEELQALDERQTPGIQRAAARGVPVTNSVLTQPPVPMMPEGDEKDTATLTRLWEEYNAARTRLQGARRDAAAREQALGETRAAQAALLAHRRAMVAKRPKQEVTA